MNPHLLKLVHIADDNLTENAAVFAETAAELLKFHRTKKLHKPTPLDILQRIAQVHAMIEMVVAADAALVIVKQAFEALGEAIAKSSPYNPEHPTTTIQVPGFPALTPRWPKDRKEWDNARLRDDVVKHARASIEEGEAVDPASGEKVPTFDQAVAVLEDVVSIIGGNIKTRGLKKIGLDADEYARTVKGTPGVQVVRS